MANRVFDFSESTAKTATEPEKNADTALTYETFASDREEATPEHPILVLDNSEGKLKHHTSGSFDDPEHRTAFIFTDERRETFTSADILKVDSRFVDLLTWLGSNRIGVRLSGKDTADGYAVYKIREVDSGGIAKLSAEDGFLQFMITRLLSSKPPEPMDEDENDEDIDDMKLTSLQSIADFLTCAGPSLPVDIRKWAKRNLAVARSAEISPEEKRHAQRALSIMLNVQWKDSNFAPIDPERARRILDEELYGMDKLKQRIIETIIQINRTHHLPAYGLLLVGPAGTGKSKIAYTVAKILNLPWTTLDMSSINDPEQLTGSSRIYANAKPGSIMEAFSVARSSNLVFIINELDKASSGKDGGDPSDALLTLLDNLGYTDNYMECMIPTNGVYPIATANDKSRISEPLMTRFTMIELPDYTPEEKKEILLRYSLPRVLKRLGMRPEECIVTDDGARTVVKKYAGIPGVRDLEQAAEHLAAHALYLIETQDITSVTYDEPAVRELLEM